MGRPKGSKNTAPKKIVIVIKTADGEILVKEFSSNVEAQTYADFAKRLGCEVLIGWGE